jgi:hypothetical protein
VVLSSLSSSLLSLSSSPHSNHQARIRLAFLTMPEIFRSLFLLMLGVNLSVRVEGWNHQQALRTFSTRSVRSCFVASRQNRASSSRREASTSRISSRIHVTATTATTATTTPDSVIDDPTTDDTTHQRRLPTTPLSPHRGPPPPHDDDDYDDDDDDNWKVQVLSVDPLIYLVPNLLSASECQVMIDRCRMLEHEGQRPMTQSNAPEISLNVLKLWPLPLLSLGAGIPPLLHHHNDHSAAQQVSIADLVVLCVPPILLAFLASLVLSFGVVLPLLRAVARGDASSLSSSSSSSSLRTSVAMAWNQNDDIPHVKHLVTQICALTNHPWTCWEAPVVTRYSTGARFARHSDASPTRGSEWKELGGQRVVTCICYLNTVRQEEEQEQEQHDATSNEKRKTNLYDTKKKIISGGTYFDQLNLCVTPVQGSALIFYPTLSQDPLQADDRTTHESLPVVGEDDEKYILQLFGRVGPRVPPPLGLPDLFSSHSHRD